MKTFLIIASIFLFFFSMAMFGYYVDLNSFAAIGGREFISSCLVGVMGLLFSYLIVGILG